MSKPARPTLSFDIAFTTDPLAAPTWTSVTSYVDGSHPLKIVRGRTNERQPFGAGKLTLTLDNRDRRFEAGYTSGAYYPNVRPGKRIRVRATYNSLTYTVWQGFITALTPRYPGGGQAWVDVQASDWFGTFASRLKLGGETIYRGTFPLGDTIIAAGLPRPGNRAVLVTVAGTTGTETVVVEGVQAGTGTPRTENLSGSGDWTATSAYRYETLTSITVPGHPSGTIAITLDTAFPEQFAGDATNAILDAAGILDADRTSTSTQTVIAAQPANNTSLLQLLQLIARTEGGQWYCNSAGQIRWDGRHTRIKQTTPTYTFGFGAGELPYVAPIQWEYDDTLIMNDITATRAGGEGQTMRDDASIAAYGPISGGESGLLLRTDAEAEQYALFLLERYKQPGLRLKALNLKGDLDPANLWPAILSIGLLTRIRVKQQPPPGTGAALQADCYVEQITHTITRTNWDVSVAVSPTVGDTWGIVGDATRGIVGTATAGY